MFDKPRMRVEISEAPGETRRMKDDKCMQNPEGLCVLSQNEFSTYPRLGGADLEKQCVLGKRGGLISSGQEVSRKFSESVPNEAASGTGAGQRKKLFFIISEGVHEED